MKKSLVLIGLISSFMFSTLVYGLERHDSVLVVDDSGMWVTGYPAPKVNIDSKQIKKTNNTSSNADIKVEKNKSKVTTSYPSTKELIRQEEARKVRGLDYMLW